MSYCGQTKTSVTVAARQTLSLGSVFNLVVDRLRAAGQRRRQCQELMDYLASDHRAAADLGITLHEARNLCSKTAHRDAHASRSRLLAIKQIVLG